MNGKALGGVRFAAAFRKGSVTAMLSPEYRASYGSIILLSPQKDDVEETNGTVVITEGGEKICEIGAEYIEEFNAVVLHVASVIPLTYKLCPARGTRLSEMVAERTCGIEYSVRWITCKGRSLCMALCGLARFNGEYIEFPGGSGYVMVCEGDDLNELSSRISRAVGLYEQGYFARRTFPSLSEKSETDLLLEIVSAFRDPDGIVFTDTEEMRVEAFTQYLAVRAYCAADRQSDAVELLRAWSACSKRKRKLSELCGPYSSSLFALAAAEIPVKRLPDDLLKDANDLLDGSVPELRRGMMPFNENENCKAARLFPEYGSAAATAAFAAAVKKTEKRAEHTGRKLSAESISAADRAESMFNDNFLPGGKPVEYSAERASGIKRKKYRFGYCAICGSDPGAGPKWTLRTQGGPYICLDCYGSVCLPPVLAEQREKSVLPVLYSEYIGARLYPVSAVNDMIVSILEGEKQLNAAYEYRMFCDVVSENPYFRRYSEYAETLADSFEERVGEISAASAAAEIISKKRKKTTR